MPLCREVKLVRRDHLVKAGVALAIVALPVLYYYRATLLGRALLPADLLIWMEPWRSALRPRGAPPFWNALIWDGAAQYYPWRLFAGEWLRAGLLPLWNPHEFCGTPFLANAQSALLYPLNLLFWVLPTWRAFGWSAALHLSLGGWFMYLFLRSLGAGRFGGLFGAICFMFGGFLITWMHLPTLVQVGIWLPLAWFAIERFFQSGRARWAAATGAVLGMAVLAGHPHMAVYVTLGAGLYFLARAFGRAEGRNRLVLAIVGGLVIILTAGLLSAGQLLPTAEFVRYGHRGGAGTYQGYLVWAMPWQNLTTLLLPDFFGNPAQGNYWGKGNYAEYAGYAGILPLLFAGFALWRRRGRVVWFFAALAAVGLLVALGTPLTELFYHAIPPLRRAGGAARIIYLYTACIAVLGGLGADWVARSLASARRVWPAAIAGSVAMLVLALVLAAGTWRSEPTLAGVSFAAAISDAAVNLVVLVAMLAVTVFALWAVTRGKLNRRPALLLLLALLTADLFVFGQGYSRTAPRRDVYPATPETDFLHEQGAETRVLPITLSWPASELPQALYARRGASWFPESALPPNSAMVYGLRDAQGYDSVYLAHYRDLLAVALDQDPSPPANGNMVVGKPGFRLDLLTVLGVSYVISPQPLSEPGLRRVPGLTVPVYALPIRPPRAWLTGAAVVVNDRREALDLLRSGEFLTLPPEIIVDPRRADSVLAATGPASVRLVGETPDRVEFDTETAGMRFLILDDTYYPGWRVRVDGVERPMQLANAAFRAVEVAPGEHRVVFRYEPASFRVGLFLTLLGAGLVAGVACASRFGVRR